MSMLNKTVPLYSELSHLSLRKKFLLFSAFLLLIFSLFFLLLLQEYFLFCIISIALLLFTVFFIANYVINGDENVVEMMNDFLIYGAALGCFDNPIEIFNSSSNYIAHVKQQYTNEWKWITKKK